MCSMLLQLTLLAVSFGSGYQAAIQTSNQTDGFGCEVLFGRLDVFEHSMKESQEMARRESQKEIKHLEETVLRELQKIKTIESGITSCRKAPNSESGRFKLKLINTALEVFCEQNLYGGGWIVIQNRFDGSVDFDREWNEYRNGFGSLDGEFWIGLEKIYLITSSGNYDLMIHLEDFNGVAKYAYYKKVEVQSETSIYYLLEPQFYNGTAGDSLSKQVYDFSTKDRDNDRVGSQHLAYNYGSGWWFDRLSNLKSNLNGLYRNGSDYDRMHWYTFNNDRQSLKVSKMMLRESV